MGLFDFFGKKRQQEADAAELLKALVQFQIEARTDGVDTDDIPKAYGPFGLCKTNPIPTKSVVGSDAYLENLRTKDGRRVTASRTGSTSAADVTGGMIDIYQLSTDGQAAATIYVCPYHKRNSSKAPTGFCLVPAAGGKRTAAQPAGLAPQSNPVSDASERAYHFQLPKGHGEFGRVDSNPIPLAASEDAVRAYLLSLRAEDGDLGRQVSIREQPSITSPNVTSRPVRVFDVTPFKASSQPVIESSRLYVVSKFAFNTTEVPEGFHFFDATPNYCGSTLCTRCGAVVETTAICQYDCPRCGRLLVNSSVERQRFVANLGALSDAYWTDEQLRAIGTLIASKRKLPPEVKQLQHLHFAEVIGGERRKRFEIPPLRTTL